MLAGPQTGHDHGLLMVWAGQLQWGNSADGLPADDKIAPSSQMFAAQQSVRWSVWCFEWLFACVALRQGLLYIVL